jgi:hypothetical protein
MMLQCNIDSQVTRCPGLWYAGRWTTPAVQGPHSTCHSAVTHKRTDLVTIYPARLYIAGQAAGWLSEDVHVSAAWRTETCSAAAVRA